ncbi:hypothetical protein B0E45_24050 [Sinorhizobium sp. A49]|uniref:CGNR zinc finger domain-containing protein n=1 Tax=Sinorhizobium sp. A49 TaxID=1945861 RepID=UPI000984F2A2|nr:ABATE domain-containing protein [Sinorhizobium sp. A49]OOG66900.1 hypothetical protein B0E45_24050 [Sinorhizobium sp. A49]
MELTAFVGEPLALDLINTRPLIGEGHVDLIGDAEGLAVWVAQEAGRLPDASLFGAATLAVEDLVAVHAVRDHLASAVRSLIEGRDVPTGDVAGLNAAMRAAPVTRHLDWGDAPAVNSERAGTPGVQLAGFLAEDAALLLAGPDARLIRKCEADDCVMLFVGNNARRRWCSAARCGNRVRVSRYYQRNRSP